MEKIVLIIAQKEFRDEEYLVPKKKFEAAGFYVDTASAEKGTCTGKLGAKVQANISINEINPDDYEAIVFVGGYGSTVYFEDPTAHGLANAAYKTGKIIAAICIAPMILVNSGILKGKNATIYRSEAELMVNKGTRYTGRDVEMDGNIVTGNGPEASGKFADAVVGLLEVIKAR